MYTLKFADGTMMSGLERNGTMFISQAELTAENFRGKLKGVEITSDDANDKELCGALGPCELNGPFHWHNRRDGLKDGYYFGLNEIPAEMLRLSRLEADVAYTAMMAEVDL